MHSCATSFDGNYAGAIALFWRSCLQSLRAGDRVLDLATGNGALPLFMRETQVARGIRVDAVDLAEVAPTWHDPALQPEINFHSGVAMERLPFPDATFDLVTSQYGLEYARWPEAVHESIRVCKPKATVAFVMHHADSILVRVARAELRGQRLLLEAGGLLDSARDVMPWIARARSRGEMQIPNASDSKERYNQAMLRIGLEIDSSIAPDLLIESRHWVHALLSAINAPDSGPQLLALASRRQMLQAAELRTAELVAHALDYDQADQLIDELRVGFPRHKVSSEPITQEEGILGWGVIAEPYD